MKLNIAFYTDTYEPAIDGVVNSINNFKRELKLRGHKVYIFASARFGNKIHNRSDTFFYHGVGFKPYPQYSVALFPYHSITTINKLDIDLIHSHTPFFMGLSGLINAKLSRLPIVGSYHTMVSNKAIINEYYPNNKLIKDMTTKYMNKYISFFYKRCNATIVPSEVIASILRRNDIANINVVPNMVDRRVFNRKAGGASAFRNSYHIKDDENVVLYVGRLSREKKLDVMLKSAKVLQKKGIKFVIVGAGPAESYYKGIARRLNLQNVIFTGLIPNKDLPGVYAACNVFCMPSTFETQGIVALEAMSSGKPVVGADYLALKDLIKNGVNGEKFRAGDYLHCSEKIEKALNNADTYTSGAVDTAIRFSPKNVTEKLIHVYKSVL
ncbi:MAG: glycosyltransferase [Candidatus Marsarchaeota archaeon]|jgi:1,2-diacylglycerol 3-alpha-glucosyltransferase|nr:glycosyltransferase [Candidatus Marsarchaeota archaeon]